MTVTLRGVGLAEEQVVAVARHREKVVLSEAARTKMEQSRTRAERASTSRGRVWLRSDSPSCSWRSSALTPRAWARRWMSRSYGR